jgi:hypothetical protein
MMSGPYFKGQIPSDCGHYDPDVLRLRDEKRKGSTYVRVIHCAHCGLLEYPLHLEHLDNKLARKLKWKGKIENIKEEDVDTVRKERLAEFLGGK